MSMQIKKIVLDQGDWGITAMMQEDYGAVSFMGAKAIDDETDLVVLTGGADVTPALYGCHIIHPKTYFNPDRDKESFACVEAAKERGIPILGICRGSQFLGVMHGLKLAQHIEGHAINGTHNLHCFNEWFQVTSTHHQGVVLPRFKTPDRSRGVLENREYTVLAKNVAVKEFYATNGWAYPDIAEAVVYERRSGMCDLGIQFHPEYVSPQHDCRKLFHRCMNVLSATISYHNKKAG